MHSGCKKNTSDKKQQEFGRLVFQFEHLVDGKPLITDTMTYVNTAGNKYEVTEIQWFVSDITLQPRDGKSLLLDSDSFAHYIDTNIPETFTWRIADSIPSGYYESITMTFGIKGEKNKPYMFTDQPESDMLWPINLGGDNGGYHYMKLNGFWIDTLGARTPFNFHLGVGQEFDENNQIVGFVQNWFEVTLPNSSFEVKKNDQLTITIGMEINNWFQNPHIYNHNIYGAKIMQNQDAMNMGKENGAKDVFSIKSIRSSFD